MYFRLTFAFELKEGATKKEIDELSEDIINNSDFYIDLNDFPELEEILEIKTSYYEKEHALKVEMVIEFSNLNIYTNANRDVDMKRILENHFDYFFDMEKVEDIVISVYDAKTDIKI